MILWCLSVHNLRTVPPNRLNWTVILVPKIFKIWLKLWSIWSGLIKIWSQLGQHGHNCCQIWSHLTIIGPNLVRKLLLSYPLMARCRPFRVRRKRWADFCGNPKLRWIRRRRRPGNKRKNYGVSTYSYFWNKKIVRIHMGKFTVFLKVHVFEEILPSIVSTRSLVHRPTTNRILAWTNLARGISWIYLSSRGCRDPKAWKKTNGGFMQRVAFFQQ